MAMAISLTAAAACATTGAVAMLSTAAKRSRMRKNAAKGNITIPADAPRIQCYYQGFVQGHAGLRYVFLRRDVLMIGRQTGIPEETILVNEAKVSVLGAVVTIQSASYPPLVLWLDSSEEAQTWSTNIWSAARVVETAQKRMSLASATSGNGEQARIKDAQISSLEARLNATLHTAVERSKRIAELENENVKQGARVKELEYALHETVAQAAENQQKVKALEAALAAKDGGAVNGSYTMIEDAMVCLGDTLGDMDEVWLDAGEAARLKASVEDVKQNAPAVDTKVADLINRLVAALKWPMQLRARLEDAEKTIEKHELEQAKVYAELQDAVDQKALDERAREQAQAEVVSLKKKLALAEKAEQAATSRLHEIQDITREEVLRNDCERAALESDRNKIKRELETYQAKLGQSEGSTKDELLQTISRLEKEQAEKAAALDEVKATQADLDRIQKERENAQKQLEDERAELIRVREENKKAMEEALARLQQEQEQKEKMLAEKTAALEQAAKAEQERLQMQKEIEEDRARTQNALEEERAKLARASDASKAEIESAIATLQKEQEAKERAAKDRTSAMDNLVKAEQGQAMRLQEGERVQLELEKERQKLAEAEAKSREAEQAATEAASRLVLLQKDVEGNKDLIKDLEAAEQKLQAEQVAKVAALEKVSKVQEEVEKLQQERRQAQDDLEKQRAELEQTRAQSLQEIAQAKQRLKEEQEQSSRLAEERKLALEQAAKSDQQAKAASDAQVQEAQMEVEKLQKEREKTQAALDKERIELARTREESMREIAKVNQRLKEEKQQSVRLAEERKSALEQAAKAEEDRLRMEREIEFRTGSFLSPDSKDVPGPYKITYDGTAVTYEMSTSSQIFTQLSIGTRINVLEVHELKQECRVRAQIDKPRGWISLLDTTTGDRWADKASVEEDPESTDAPNSPRALAEVKKKELDARLKAAERAVTSVAQFGEPPAANVERHASPQFGARQNVKAPQPPASQPVGSFTSTGSFSSLSRTAFPDRDSAAQAAPSIPPSQPSSMPSSMHSRIRAGTPSATAPLLPQQGAGSQSSRSVPSAGTPGTRLNPGPVRGQFVTLGGGNRQT